MVLQHSVQKTLCGLLSPRLLSPGHRATELLGRLYGSHLGLFKPICRAPFLLLPGQLAASTGSGVGVPWLLCVALGVADASQLALVRGLVRLEGALALESG